MRNGSPRAKRRKALDGGADGTPCGLGALVRSASPISAPARHHNPLRGLNFNRATSVSQQNPVRVGLAPRHRHEPSTRGSQSQLFEPRLSQRWTSNGSSTITMAVIGSTAVVGYTNARKLPLPTRTHARQCGQCRVVASTTRDVTEPRSDLVAFRSVQSASRQTATIAIRRSGFDLIMTPEVSPNGCVLKRSSQRRWRTLVMVSSIRGSVEVVC
jgi:hypothetical protein